MSQLTDVLGPAAATRYPLPDDGEPLLLHSAATEGLPYAALESTASWLDLSATQAGEAIGLTDRTVARRKASRQLTPDESARVLQLARAVARAADVFGDEAAVARWFATPCRALGQRPLALMSSPFGAEAVLAELTRLEHGVVS